MTLEFTAGDQHLREDFATHIYPFLEPLLGALRVLRDGYVDEKIILFLGSPQCELCLRAEVGAPEAVLHIDLWPNHKRSKLTSPQTLFRIQRGRVELIEPFAAAVKKLRAGINDADFAREYGAPFPTSAYDQLLAALI
jgi:hypothetical protein